METTKTRFSQLTPEEAIPLLDEIGDTGAVEALTKLVQKNPELNSTNLSDLPESDILERARWRGTEHAYGYVQVDDDNNDFFDIIPATTLVPDQTLKGQQLNIKLGSLYTMNYPGFGRHNVLMHFRCKHQDSTSNDTKLIEFEQKFKSIEGEGAGDIGSFVFFGLRAPSNGLEFHVQTVNISNDSDEGALQVLESDTIKNGLDLVNASFSTLAPFTDMAKGVLGLLLARNRNKTVQDFKIGFDFDESAVDIAKLKLGTYVVAQAKRNEMPWSDWVYQRSTGLVVNKQDKTKRLPYNHISFNVLKYHP